MARKNALLLAVQVLRDHPVGDSFSAMRISLQSSSCGETVSCLSCAGLCAVELEARTYRYSLTRLLECMYFRIANL